MSSDTKNISGVIWVTGYSSSGKTTVGRKVELHLRESGIRTIFLDGDDLRSIFANKWGYSRSERIELAKIYFRLCSHLAAQGFTLIISAIAMYDEVRSWLRENVEGSIEVYLDVPESERRRRDAVTKGIYEKKGFNEGMYDLPKSPDLIIQNFGERDPDSVALEVSKYFMEQGSKKESDRGRHSHWNNYYKSAHAPLEASSFAQYVAACINGSQNKLIEIGCGNGRDAVFFSSIGCKVTALDTSDSAIAYCLNEHSSSGVKFITKKLGDFVTENSGKFDVLYSRFCLHAMTPSEERDFIENSYKITNADGRLFIECRSINDPLARKGEIISSTERIHGHYRRFIVLEELSRDLKKVGFDIHLAEEFSGVAKLGDDDPVVIRVVATKNKD